MSHYIRTCQICECVLKVDSNKLKDEYIFQLEYLAMTPKDIKKEKEQKCEIYPFSTRIHLTQKLSSVRPVCSECYKYLKSLMENVCKQILQLKDTKKSVTPLEYLATIKNHKNICSKIAGWFRGSK